MAAKYQGRAPGKNQAACPGRPQKKTQGYAKGKKRNHRSRPSYHSAIRGTKTEARTGRKTSPARKAYQRDQLRKHSNTLILLLLIILVAVALVISASVSHKRRLASVNADAQAISASVMEYQPLVERYAAQYQISDYEEYLLAIMEVETGGNGSADLMQSSESAGLSMDSLGEEESVKQGCAYFADCLEAAKDQGCDLNTVIQSYNYGKGFVTYVADHGGSYSFDLAQDFAKDQSGGKKTDYNAQIAVETNGGWRYQYGNMFYVPLVEQYVSLIRELE